MERTITQNGALYALHHRASTRQSNKAQIKRASDREKIPPPRLGVNRLIAGYLAKSVFHVQTDANLHLPAR